MNCSTLAAIAREYAEFKEEEEVLAQLPLLPDEDTLPLSREIQ